MTKELTHEQKLEAVRAKIIEAVPSIMELDFGCEVKINSYPWRIIGDCTPVGNIDQEKRIFSIFSLINGVQSTFDSKYNFKIIGRPIRLADIMIVLHQKYPNIKNTCWYCLGADGWIFETMNSVLMIARFKWDLPNDDLNDQSPETISFLFDLLC